MSEPDGSQPPPGSVPWRRAAQVAAAIAVALGLWWAGETVSHLPGPPVVPVSDRLVVELESSPSPTTSSPTPQPTVSIAPPAPPPEVTPPITRQPLPDDDDDDTGDDDDDDDDDDGGDDDD